MSTKPDLNYTGSCNCTYSMQHKCRVCTQDHPSLHCAKCKSYSVNIFVSMPHPSTSELTSDLQTNNKLQTINYRQFCFKSYYLSCHILASQSDQPNTFWEKMPVPTALNIHMWDHLLLDFDDKIVVKILKGGWPINYQSHQLPPPIQHNHPSALAFMDHVRTYIKAELSFNAIASRFLKNPLQQHLICSPLQTILKCGSIKCHVVMDLSYPPSFSVKSGILMSMYLDSPFQFYLLRIERLCEFNLT